MKFEKYVCREKMISVVVWFDDDLFFWKVREKWLNYGIGLKSFLVVWRILYLIVLENLL